MRIAYAQKKIASVRTLYRTSLPIPTPAGPIPPKALHPIIGGIVTLKSEWNPPMGQFLVDAIQSADSDSRIDLGCIAAQGMFSCDGDARYSLVPNGKPATAFLFELIARLQTIATVPMIDVPGYAKWLDR